MHADSTPQILESLVYSKRGALYLSLQFKLRMEETVCGSYDSKSVPVAERIYSFPSTGAIVTETRVPLKSCLLFLSFALPLSVPLSIFHKRTTSRAGAGYSFLIQCASVPVARKILPRPAMACSPNCRGKYNEKIRLRFSRAISRPRRNDGERDWQLPSSFADSIRSPLKNRHAEWVRRCDGTLTANRKRFINCSKCPLIAIGSNNHMSADVHSDLH